MAFFYRGILTSCPLLNSSYCSIKLFTDVRMFKMCRQCLKPVLSRNLSFNRKPPVKQKFEEENHAYDFLFEKMLHRRKEQAKSSILVQVNSRNAHSAVYNYCSKFGEILAMHYYGINRGEHFLLVEFKSTEIVQNIISSASFIEAKMIIPIKTRTLWFSQKKEALYLKDNTRGLKDQMLPNLYINNSLDEINDNQLVEALQRVPTVSGQIMCLYDKLKLSELEIRLRFYIVSQLEEMFSSTIHHVAVFPFGSSVNGFGKHGCDLDLVLLVQSDKKRSNGPLIFHSKESNLEDRGRKVEFMTTLSRIMSQFMPGIRNVRDVLRARVPIIKFVHRFTNIECDLSMNSMIGVHMSDLLHVYSLIDLRVRPLMFTIRTWASKQKLTRENPGSWITNFSLSLLIIYYLQSKNIIPTLNQLKVNAACEDIRYSDSNVDCTFLRDVRNLRLGNISKNKESLDSLLCGFFQFYSTFNFETQAICIREGKVKQKLDAAAICIINPFEQSLNVAKNMTVLELNHFLMEVRETLKKIQNNPEWNLLPLLDYEVLPFRKDQTAINLTSIYNEKKAKNERDKLNKQADTLKTDTKIVPDTDAVIIEKSRKDGIKQKVNSVAKNREEGRLHAKTESILKTRENMYNIK